MDKVKFTLTNWLLELENFKFPDYDEFPDIDLYMDQVITYLERELQVLQTSSLDKVITPSMINNYVKGDVVTAPISKKYNREHLALINETCSLKQVLSIAEIKQVLDVEYKDKNKADVFNKFKELSSDEFKKAIDTANEAIKDLDDNDTDSFTDIAMKMAVTANAYITIAKRMLFYNRKYLEMKEIRKELDAKRKKDDMPVQQELDLNIEDEKND